MRMMLARGLAAAWLLVLLFHARPSAAATLFALDLKQLVQLSDHVVLAKAEARQARKDERSGAIVTDVTLRVLSSVKGGAAVGSTLTATLLGGSIGQLGLKVPGEAVIPDDRSAIIFLRKNSQAELNVTGMSQGMLPIFGAGQAARVQPGGSDAELVERDRDGTLRGAPAALRQPQPLGELLTELRRLAALPAGER